MSVSLIGITKSKHSRRALPIQLMPAVIQKPVQFGVIIDWAPADSARITTPLSAILEPTLIS